jgi:DNA-binding MurR/RpiR family transcriptional regulator
MIRASYMALSLSERKIADYLLQRPTEAIYLSITDVADRAAVGEATVSRFCRKLGFRGFQELKVLLAQEVVPAAMSTVGPHGDGNLVTATRQTAQHALRVIEDTARLLDQQELERAITLLTAAHKIDFYGLGTSGITALDAQHKFLALGKLCNAYVDPHVQVMSAALLTRGDVAVAFSHSGSTKDAVTSLQAAKDRGASTICITSAARSPITRAADVVLLAATREMTVARSLCAKITHLFLVELLVTCCAERLGEGATRAADLTMAAVMDKMF